MNSAMRWLPAEAGQAGGARSRRCPGPVTGAVVAGRQGRSQGRLAGLGGGGLAGPVAALRGVAEGGRD
jgi:hypothetical protein